MKKVFNVCLVSLMILIFASMSISYALTDTSESEEESFFEVSSEEVSIGDTLEMTINLSLIEWTQIKFTLNSNLDVSSTYTDDETNITIESEETEENSENEEYVITFEIDTSTLELSEIVLYYEIPKDMEVGDTFTLTATIADLKDEENAEECEFTITIVESTSSNTQDSNFVQNETVMSTTTQDMTQSSFESTLTTQNNSLDMDENTSSSSKSDSVDEASSSSMSQEEEVTYNGSSNNYLSELYIDGYSLNKDFNKESTTYFVTVNDTESLNITAIAEDDEAVVCIYGTDSLSNGENKVLISVTAENGSVRYYRIYVTVS